MLDLEVMTTGEERELLGDWMHIPNKRKRDNPEMSANIARYVLIILSMCERVHV